MSAQRDAGAGSGSGAAAAPPADFGGDAAQRADAAEQILATVDDLM